MIINLTSDMIIGIMLGVFGSISAMYLSEKFNMWFKKREYKQIKKDKEKESK